MDLDKKYPTIADLEAAALPRLPKFVRDYLTHGIGDGISLRKNRTALAQVELVPRYLAASGQPDIGCRLFGQQYSAPFGVAPIGLAGLVWPRAEALLATAARQQQIPYVLSTVATLVLEEARPLAGDGAWFQLYTPRDTGIRDDILDRAAAAGYETLVVTVDVPYRTRRAHDMRNGLSVPPRFDWRNLWQMVRHPPWAWRMLAAGVPKFANIAPYYNAGASPGRTEIERSVRFIKDHFGVRVTHEVFGQIRGRWQGNLVVKGVLRPEEARAYVDAGADGVVVSNHGGRQLDAAPTAVDVLPQIRHSLGTEVPLLADGGARSGLDIARLLALGADFVLLGRPFMYAVAALGGRGGGHAVEILKAELQTAMGQLGCGTTAELPGFLAADSRG